MREKPEQIIKIGLRYCLKKIQENMEELKASFPFITIDGKWKITTDEDWEGLADGYWVNGFWVGMLWLSYKVTKTPTYKNIAYKLCELIGPRKYSNKIHDLGFLFYPSFCLGYEVIKEENLKDSALLAANSLLSRFNDKINAIPVIGKAEESGLTAIDTMMNLPLFWWAYEKSGDERYYDVAYRHSITTMKHFIREDGSTYHIVEFDPNSGQIFGKSTMQGYSDTSCWSRGQAWGIYGFAIAYEYTRKEEILRAAERLADYYIVNCPPDHVPYWDFNDPAIPDAVKDSSAAAIVASGLIDLSNIEPDKVEAERYKEAASKILESLSKNYLTISPDSQGILLHGCFNKPDNIATDNSLIWGDYYYMEALTKLLRKEYKI